MDLTPSPLKHYKTVEEYEAFAERFLEFENKEEKFKLNRLLCRTDLYWLIRFVCKRNDFKNQWLMDRCKEIEAEPNGCLDLWARDHRKSTTVTFGKSIQDILASHGDDPLPEWKREVTIGILSSVNKLAKDFLKQIKEELESNDILKSLFPDILYDKPASQSPKWSEQDGIIVKRKSNPKEATIESSGLIDGQPTGKHYLIRVYDDIVTDETVNTPEQILKTTSRWQMSSNLGTSGEDSGIVRYVGTRYHALDTYGHILKIGKIKPRIYPATEDGTPYGKPVFLKPEQLATKREEQGNYVFACQMLLNPTADSSQNFKEEWLKYYGGWDKSRMVGNIYIICDPAGAKKKGSDYTAFMVVAAVVDGNYYLVDMVRDRMNLKERTDMLFSLVKEYQPVNVGYEKYGKDSDIEHIEEKMDQLNYRFRITALGGQTAKNDRIGKLVPDFEYSRIYLPFELWRKNYEGKQVNLIKSFIEEEYLVFPTPVHDDMLDCLARIKDKDMEVTFPVYEEDEYEETIQRSNNVTGY